MVGIGCCAGWEMLVFLIGMNKSSWCDWFGPTICQARWGQINLCAMSNIFTELARKASAVLCVVFALSACAIAPPQPWHAFSFDGWFDNWADQVDLLEYQYGDKYEMVHRVVKPGYSTIGSRENVNGPMPIGDFLYVKWRIKKTGEIMEDRVDLRGRLALNMQAHRITFVIDGRELYVYLVTPAPKHKTDPPLLKTYESRYNVAYEIYPHNTYLR
jgi:hypothetical protein